MQALFCDVYAVSRGNPGPTTVTAVVTGVQGQILSSVVRDVGNSTSLHGTYQAVLLGLDLLRAQATSARDSEVVLRLSEELVMRQLAHEVPITDPGLVPLFMAVHNYRVEFFPNITFTQIPLEQNIEADRLVNEILDGKR